MKNSPLIIPGEPAFNPQFDRKPSGAIIIEGQEVAHTLQCGHCGGHWVLVRGSKRKRGFCLSCKRPTCGKIACNRCRENRLIRAAY